MRIYLTGFMGTGKSTLGKAIARHLNIPFLDTDELVEATAGMPIREIFARYGEERFRELERNALITGSALSNAVIATGGGIVVDQRNRDLMISTGFVVNLRADPEVIYSRIASDPNRPLLRGPDPRKTIGNLLDRRNEFYGQCHLTIDTGIMTEDEIVRSICSAIPACSRKAVLPECHPFHNGYFIRVELDLGKRSHPILIRANGLDEIGPLMLKYVPVGSGAVVVSEPVAWSLFGPRVQASLSNAGIRTGVFLIGGSESSKSIHSAIQAYDYLVSFGALRDTAIVALGGGVVGDLAGFVAATYMRGLPFVQASTTLLAQVDAGIGGKCAVDHKNGKNLIGSIYQPKLCLIDPFTLLSLPATEFRQGLAEVVKYGFLIGDEFLSYLEANVEPIREMSMEVLTELVAKCASYKASLVQIDEDDRNQRQFLNLGHTLAHAMESIMDYSGIRHGDAVSVGLAWAIGLSERLGLCPPGLQQRAVQLLERLGLPIEIPGILRAEPHLLVKRMMLDKKNRQNRIRLVLLRNPGEPVLVDDISQEIIERSFE